MDQLCVESPITERETPKGFYRRENEGQNDRREGKRWGKRKSFCPITFSLVSVSKSPLVFFNPELKKRTCKPE